MVEKSFVVRDLGDMVMYTNANFEIVFDKFREQDKTNGRFAFFALLSATCIYFMNKRIKKQEEAVKTLRKEIDGMKTSEEE